MKHKLLPLLLAFIVGAAILTACQSGKSNASPDEVTNLVYPVGEGNFYTTDPPVETDADTTADPSAASSATTQPTTVKPKKQKTTQPTTRPAATRSTQPTSNPNVPKDNIGPGNVNPGISGIQSRMMSIINSLELKSISLSKTSLELAVGESAQLQLKFNPTDAPNKSCTYSASNGNVTVTHSGTAFTVTGKTAGKCMLTVTSHNGHRAVCDITVKGDESPATAATKPTTAPTSEATSETDPQPDATQEP